MIFSFQVSILATRLSSIPEFLNISAITSEEIDSFGNLLDGFDASFFNQLSDEALHNSKVIPRMHFSSKAKVGNVVSFQKVSQFFLNKFPPLIIRFTEVLWCFKANSEIHLPYKRVELTLYKRTENLLTQKYVRILLKTSRGLLLVLPELVIIAYHSWYDRCLFYIYVYEPYLSFIDYDGSPVAWWSNVD